MHTQIIHKIVLTALFFFYYQQGKNIYQNMCKRNHVIFLNQVDDAESLEWDFQFKNQYLTLHYNIYGGVSISPCKLKNINQENKAVLEVATFLSQRVF